MLDYACLSRCDSIDGVFIGSANDVPFLYMHGYIRRDLSSSSSRSTKRHFFTRPPPRRGDEDLCEIHAKTHPTCFVLSVARWFNFNYFIVYVLPLAIPLPLPRACCVCSIDAEPSAAGPRNPTATATATATVTATAAIQNGSGPEGEPQQQGGSSREQIPFVSRVFFDT